MKFHCKTSFDVTNTGITGHYKSDRGSFRDKTGKMITNVREWTYARNQQRNWETITQILSLRTQLNEITAPVNINGFWHFEFETDTPEVFGIDDSPLEILRTDINGVPMLTLTEGEPSISTLNLEENIWILAN
jgi:hypothetical protein